VLVVGDRDRREVAGHLGGDGKLTRGDEGVVGRFEVRGVIPIEIARRQQHNEEDQAADERQRVALQYAPAGLVTALVVRVLDIVIFAFRRHPLYPELAWCMILRGRRPQPDRKQ